MNIKTPDGIFTFIQKWNKILREKTGYLSTSVPPPSNVPQVPDTHYQRDNMQQKYRLILALSVLVLTALTTVVSAEENNSNEFLFILGTDFNEVALNNATSNTNISEQLNITIFNTTETVPDGFNFSNYSVIFIESQSESMVNGWQANLASNLTIAKDNGSKVIGYNISSNITVANVDLYSSDYTNIERYWVQGSDTNMESMLKFIGQAFCGAWVNETIPDPELLHPKINITFILNY
ncbi:MAG: hypothetical protein KAI84_04120, partial [Gammaproteobacteria bacterium]|nr:hypothetical protein [Gammaproteobacteria bacterium]